MTSHSIAECTICSFKAIAFSLIYGFFRYDGMRVDDDELSEDEKLIQEMNQIKRVKKEEEELADMLPLFDELH